MKTVIPVELLKQTPELFISPSVLYNFFHSSSYFRRPNLSIFFPIFAIPSPKPILWLDQNPLRDRQIQLNQTIIINTDNSAVSQRWMWKSLQGYLVSSGNWHWEIICHSLRDVNVMVESLFICWKSIWRYQEITVDSTRQDGPWTVHLKLDKTWHSDKILFKVS